MTLKNSEEERQETTEEAQLEEPRVCFTSQRRVKTPIIVQLEVTECAAVCLAIVLAYYEKYVPIEELRVACNVTRNGSRAWNLIEAAKKYGLEANGYGVDLKEIPSLTLPAILFWEFEHFVVLEGYGKETFFINDPAMGQRELTFDEFNRGFTGLVVECVPTKAFVKSGKPVTWSRLLQGPLSSVKGPLLFIFLTALALVPPSLALPAFSQIFIDQMLLGHDFSWGYGLLTALFLVIVVVALLSFMQKKALIYLREKLSVNMACNALWHLLHLPITFFSQRYAREVAYRMTLIDSITSTLTGQLALTCLDCLMIVIYGLAVYYYSPLLAAVAVLAGALNLGLLFHVLQTRKNDVARYQAAAGRSSGFSLGLIDNIQMVKAIGVEKQAFATWSGHYTKMVNALHAVSKKNVLLAVIPALVNALTVAAFIGIGAWKVLEEDLSVGMFVSVQILMANFMYPLMRLVGLSQVLQYLKSDLTRFNDLMCYPIDPQFKVSEQIGSGQSFVGAVSSKRYRKLQGYIELNNVTYGHSRQEPPLLTNIDLKLQPGKSIAIVGATGCGKSTLAWLVAGLLTPWEGEILYDGQPSCDLPREEFTASLALIEQFPFLFKGSIRNNLTLLETNVRQEELDRATKDACIYDEIMARRQGFDMDVTDNGGNLSAGQRQRLEIARGLLKNPSILILDEATGALDSQVEATIMHNIQRRGSAILMIAHRLSSIKHCDEICVIEKGRIVDRGTHEFLKSHSQYYMELISSEE